MEIQLLGFQPKLVTDKLSDCIGISVTKLNQEILIEETNLVNNLQWTFPFVASFELNETKKKGIFLEAHKADGFW